MAKAEKQLERIKNAGPRSTQFIGAKNKQDAIAKQTHNVRVYQGRLEEFRRRARLAGVPHGWLR